MTLSTLRKKESQVTNHQMALLGEPFWLGVCVFVCFFSVYVFVITKADADNLADAVDREAYYCHFG